VEKLNFVHEAQWFSYLWFYGRKLGLLIDFHVGMLKHGILRVVNNFPDSATSAV
jgi:PD-(D/E)XK nuclease superfamily